MPLDRKRLLGHVETIQFILGVTDNVCYKAVILLLLSHCLLLLKLFFFGFCVWSLFCCAVLNAGTSSAITSPGKRELIALLLLHSDVM